MDSIAFAILCAAAVVVFVIWLQVKTMKLNKKRKAEGKEPVGTPPPVNVIDWTRK